MSRSKLGDVLIPLAYGDPDTLADGLARMGRGPRRLSCYYCGGASDGMCDGKLERIRYPRKSGSKLCNRALCSECAFHVEGHDLDYCRAHVDEGRALALQGRLFMSESDRAWKTGQGGSWSFDDIGEPFDCHVRKHLPGYDEIEALAVSAAMWNVTRDARVLDVGCATGHTLALLNARSPWTFQGLGIDVDEKMIETAKSRVAAAEFRCADFLDFDFGPSAEFDVVFALFTLQFMPIPKRRLALQRVFELLAPGGLFVLAEKTEASSPKVADLYSGIYSDWKLQQGVDPDEVLAKWASLRGQLVTCRAEHYRLWAAANDLEGDEIWAWGPFRAWAFWKPAAL